MVVPELARQQGLESLLYLQNYVNGVNMPGLTDQLRRTYLPEFKDRSARLFLARQWHRRRPSEEGSLQRRKPVSGLVFSSFRHDNPGAGRRND